MTRQRKMRRDDMHDEVPPTMQPPLVSVIIPVYNTQEFIGDAVNSILVQTMDDLEVIVIDDASTDLTGERVGAIRDPRVRLHRVERNQRQGACMNLGMQLARGTFIARLDADDLSASDRLQKQVGFLRRHTEIGAVGGWGTTFGDRHVRHLVYPTHPDDVAVYLLFTSPVLHSSVMFRRELIEKGGLQYDSSLLYGEDYDFFIRMERITKIANVPEYLVRYRINPAGVTSSRQSQIGHYVSWIHASYFSRLGIAVSKAEQILHLQLAIGQGHPCFQSVIKWIGRLRQINAERGYWREPFFSRYLARRLAWAILFAKGTALEKLKLATGTRFLFDLAPDLLGYALASPIGLFRNLMCLFRAQPR